MLDVCSSDSPQRPEGPSVTPMSRRGRSATTPSGSSIFFSACFMSRAAARGRSFGRGGLAKTRFVHACCRPSPAVRGTSGRLGPSVGSGPGFRSLRARKRPWSSRCARRWLWEPLRSGPSTFCSGSLATLRTSRCGSCARDGIALVRAFDRHRGDAALVAAAAGEAHQRDGGLPPLELLPHPLLGEQLPPPWVKTSGVRLAGAPAGRRFAQLAGLRLAGRARALPPATRSVQHPRGLAAVAAGLAAHSSSSHSRRSLIPLPRWEAPASGVRAGGPRDRRACPRGCRPHTRWGPPTPDSPSSEAQGDAARSRGQPPS
jgi:hypothetical protein